MLTHRLRYQIERHAASMALAEASAAAREARLREEASSARQRVDEMEAQLKAQGMVLRRLENAAARVEERQRREHANVPFWLRPARCRVTIVEQPRLLPHSWA